LRRKPFLRRGEQDVLHRGAEYLPTRSVIVLSERKKGGLMARFDPCLSK
jgi:hypothetical protein